MGVQRQSIKTRLLINARITLLVFISSLGALSTACGSNEGVFVSGTTTPVFQIRRSFSNEVRVFPLLMVARVHPENVSVPTSEEEASKNQILWRIVADPKSQSTADVETIEKVEYGKVPVGFVQEIPNPGVPAPTLQENEIYEVIGPMSLMHNAVARFKISNGKVVSLSE